MTDKIRVLIVDDHHLIRTSLASFLNTYPDLNVVGEAANGSEAILMCEALQPDVILMDLVLPVKDGVETTKEILGKYPKTRILALTGYPDHERVNAAFEAGVIGYITKDSTPDELVDAIRNAYSGKTTMSTAVLERLMRNRSSSTQPRFELTERELSILNLLSTGSTNRQIAGELALSPATVKSYVSRILSKLGVSSRVEAVAIAIKAGLIDP